MEFQLFLDFGDDEQLRMKVLLNQAYSQHFVLNLKPNKSHCMMYVARIDN